jgi:hypothetical protein
MEFMMGGKDYDSGIAGARIVKRLERKGSNTQKGQHPDLKCKESNNCQMPK